MAQATEENYDFYKVNGYMSLLNVGDQIDYEIEALYNVVQSIITHQVEKKPKEMDKEERDKWFTSTLSQLVKINQMMMGVKSEVIKMTKDL